MPATGFRAPGWPSPPACEPCRVTYGPMRRGALVRYTPAGRTVTFPGWQASSAAWSAAVSSVVPSPLAPWSLTFTHPASAATAAASPAETAVADRAIPPTATADLRTERREFGPVMWCPPGLLEDRQPVSTPRKCDKKRTSEGVCPV